MGALLKNLHWLIILTAVIFLVKDYFELSEEMQILTDEKGKVEEEIVKNEKVKKDIKKYLGNIEEERNKIERVAQEIEKTQQLLPSDISDTENLSLLRKMAEDINIKEVSISPENDDNRGFYIARKYHFKAKATYLQFLIMFEKISENRRILNINELDFKKLDQPQRSKFQLIDGSFYLEAYKYNSNFKEDRGLEQLDKQFRGAGESADSPKKKPRPAPKSDGGE